MTLEEAIRTAIEYEIQVRDVYADASAAVKDKSGQKVLHQLALEEQEHVTYLVASLKEWKSTGIISNKPIPRNVPGPEQIARKIAALKNRIAQKTLNVTDQESDISMLNKALDVERETSGFYQRMVDEMPSNQKEIFKRFLEIEKGHLAIVEAEIDFLSGAGYWFGLQEFNLEVE